MNPKTLRIPSSSVCRVATPLGLVITLAVFTGCQSTPRADVDAARSAGEATGFSAQIEFIAVGPDGGPLDEPDAAGAELTLADALRRAVTTDPGLQAAMARVRIALADADQSRLLPNPVLNVVLRWGPGKPQIEASLAQDFVQALQIPRRSSAADNRMRQAAAWCLAAAPGASLKHVIEACGVPHTEVGAIRVNGQPAGFAERVADGDHIEVRGWSAADLQASHGLRRWPPAQAMRFVADAHLGGLARRLRMAGFDTLFRNDFADREIAALAAAEGRIVLTRDRGLLQHRAISHACYLHAIAPDPQFRELVARLALRPGFRPFSRCIECNAPLAVVDKAEVLGLLPPSVRAHHVHFTRCTGRGRVFWAGSHWRRMVGMLDAA